MFSANKKVIALLIISKHLCQNSRVAKIIYPKLRTVQVHILKDNTRPK